MGGEVEVHALGGGGRKDQIDSAVSTGRDVMQKQYNTAQTKWEGMCVCMLTWEFPFPFFRGEVWMYINV